MSRRTRKLARKLKADKYGAYYALVFVALVASAFFVFDKYLYQIDWESWTNKQNSVSTADKKRMTNKGVRTSFDPFDPKLNQKIKNADLSILFIGNDHTTTENIPRMVKYMIQSADPEMQILIESHTALWMNLSELAESEQTRELIAAGEWDFVVLQGENSQSTYNAIRKISSWKESRKSQLVLFSTWTPRSEIGMSREIHRQYLKTARIINADVVPVGMAWMESQLADEEIELYYVDYRHADFPGAFLTACVFYCYFTKSDVSQMKSENLFELDNVELTEDVRQQLKQIAWSAYRQHAFLH